MYATHQKKNQNSGILGAVGSHLIDLISFLLNGKKVTSVSGEVSTLITRRTFGDQDEQDPQRFAQTSHAVTADDYASAQLRFEDNLRGSLLVCTIVAGEPQFSVQVSGSKGTLILNKDSLILRRSGKDQSLSGEVVVKDQYLESPLNNAWGTGTYLIAKSIFNHLQLQHQQQDQPHAKKQKLQSELLETAASFEQGEYVQKVLDAIRLSSSLRKWVDVN